MNRRSELLAEVRHLARFLGAMAAHVAAGPPEDATPEDYRCIARNADRCAVLREMADAPPRLLHDDNTTLHRGTGGG